MQNGLHKLLITAILLLGYGSCLQIGGVESFDIAPRRLIEKNNTGIKTIEDSR